MLSTFSEIWQKYLLRVTLNIALTSLLNIYFVKFFIPLLDLKSKNYRCETYYNFFELHFVHNFSAAVDIVFFERIILSTRILWFSFEFRKQLQISVRASANSFRRYLDEIFSANSVQTFGWELALTKISWWISRSPKKHKRQ